MFDFRVGDWDFQPVRRASRLFEPIKNPVLPEEGLFAAERAFYAAFDKPVLPSGGLYMIDYLDECNIRRHLPHQTRPFHAELARNGELLYLRRSSSGYFYYTNRKLGGVKDVGQSCKNRTVSL